MHPLVILAIGMALVLGMILVLRLNAFVALITAAVVVSMLSPGAWAEKIPRVAVAFGVSTGKIGIPIAMAAIIGSCLLASGAAQRIVRAMLDLFGEKRAATALAASGFTLSIPVFFDTVFFLLVPLGRSLYRQTGKHYLKYLLAIGAGGAIAHTLIPPTPGPLLVADQLQVDVGLMMLAGIAIGLPSMAVGLLVAGWMDRHIRLANPPKLDDSDNNAVNPPEPTGDARSTSSEASTPGMLVSLLPVLLPVLLVASKTIFARLAEGNTQNDALQSLATITALVGDPNFALLLAAAVALVIFVLYKRPSPAARSKIVEESLLSAGIIILVTAAGGAFGGMLQTAGVGPAIEKLFASGEATSGAAGMAMLWIAFGIASLLKISQGSSTVAMIAASGMMAAMTKDIQLDYNHVYLALAIGCGSLFGVWMNDSGFWLFCRMGGLTESEGLKSWTAILAIIAAFAMLLTVGLSRVLPLVETAAATT